MQEAARGMGGRATAGPNPEVPAAGPGLLPSARQAATLCGPCCREKWGREKGGAPDRGGRLKLGEAGEEEQLLRDGADSTGSSLAGWVAGGQAGGWTGNCERRPVAASGDQWL